RRRRRARPASGPAAAEEPHQKVRGRAPAPRRRTAAPDARPAPEPRATPRAQPGPPPQRRPETPAGRRVEARPEPAPMARPEPTAAPKASMPRRRRPAPEPGTMPRASMREDWNSPSQARRQEMPARPMPRVRYRDERPPREFDR
ncbi:hypothetical protein HCA44_08465, partial [Rhodococcus sp. HNM0569]|nr:hypothetical protein [Rhodococcus sp. HNM0569]